MALFKKRETLTQNMAYMAIMAAINVVFVLLTTFVPVLMVLLVLVLPLTNVVVTLFCRKRYFIIYAIVTVGLCMLVTMWNITDTILYVIPSIVTGFLFGFMIEKKIPAVFIILTTTIIQFAFTFAFIPLIDFLFHQNMITVFATAFGLASYKYLDYIVTVFVSFVALAQSTISYLFIKKEIPKLGFEVTVDADKYYYVIVALEVICIVMFILFAFVMPTAAFTFIVFALFCAIYLMIDLFTKSNTLIWILLFLALVAGVLLFAIFYQQIPKPFGISLFMIFFVLASIIAIVNNCLFKARLNKDKITLGN